MRSKRLTLNIISAFIFRIVTVVCGIILPRLILQSYGSKVNGLAVSIEQFLAVIVLAELGVGSVVQSALYKPLAEKNHEKISRIIASGNKFFKKVAGLLFVYVLFLIIIYPLIINKDFGWLYTILLILVISISFFSEYYFGMMDRLLMAADQKGYILYNIQSIAQILNTIVSAFLITRGISIHIVKLTHSTIFLLRVTAWRFYVTRHYHIDRKTQYDTEPIPQKWNGVAQHISEVLLKSTDNVVLSVFSTISNVSIYSLYQMLVSGLEQLFLAITNEIKSLLGELWVKGENEKLVELFALAEWGIHTSVIYIFGITSIVIIPFIDIYTQGITDAVYIQPLFATLLTLAYAWHCLRFPYQIMIFAAGHYKQTQNNYMIVALVNIIISIVLVHTFDLIGVALGTLIAAMFHTLWMAVYNSKNLIHWSILNILKQFSVDALTVLTGTTIFRWTGISQTACSSWKTWLILGVKTAFLWFLVVIIINWIFYNKNIIKLINKLTRCTSLLNKYFKH